MCKPSKLPRQNPKDSSIKNDYCSHSYHLHLLSLLMNHKFRNPFVYLYQTFISSNNYSIQSAFFYLSLQLMWPPYKHPNSSSFSTYISAVINPPSSVACKGCKLEYRHNSQVYISFFFILVFLLERLKRLFLCHEHTIELAHQSGLSSWGGRQRTRFKPFATPSVIPNCIDLITCSCSLSSCTSTQEGLYPAFVKKHTRVNNDAPYSRNLP